MKIFKSISDWKNFRASLSGSVGFAPTMGALHAGHFSLFKNSLQQNDFTIGSIFVNPTQFNDANDLKNYPSTLADDLEQLDKLGVTAVLTPTFADMYPDNYHYKVCEDQFSNQLCGASRPGHFDGVLTIVLKLLQLVQPTHVYFGEKDYQQLKLIKKMLEAFFIPTEVVAVSTVREANGLAMSSRNKRLSHIGRALAPKLYEVISSDISIDDKKNVLTELGFQVDYIDQHEGRIFAAAKLEDVRLIDNVKR